MAAGLLKAAEDQGRVVSHLTPEEIKEWTDLAKVVAEAKIAELEAKGVPAKSVYQELQQLIANYK
jgi:DNA-binding GntR family transcriptional regulator